MVLTRKLKILWRWSRFIDGLPSLWRAALLTRTGRYGGELELDRAACVCIKGIPWKLWVRPGTDDLLVLTELFDHGEYRAVQTLVRKPVRVIVDLGTNVGYASAYFASLYPEARLIGVEPSESNLAMASRSLAPLIASGRVVIHHGFIGAVRRTAVIARGGAMGSNELFLADRPATGGDSTAPVLTVGDLIVEHGIREIDLLKCDIEGGEKELFNDCAAWIKCVRHIVIELHGDCTIDWLHECLRRGGGDFEDARVEVRPGRATLAWLRSKDVIGS
jgi:FkbM family methyltransferase